MERTQLRARIYEILDDERDYQDKKWVGYNDADWSINDWLLFIERQIAAAKAITGDNVGMMDFVRKIGGLAVAAMEHNHTEPRG
jgi:hypothetical protein